MWVDVSQSIRRRPWVQGPRRCTTTCCQWYSYDQDRCLVAEEYLFSQGYGHGLDCLLYTSDAADDM
eukprot:4075768-Alexandrium_andersonii.AAC.1